jgi:hypothetical protein
MISPLIIEVYFIERSKSGTKSFHSFDYTEGVFECGAQGQCTVLSCVMVIDVEISLAVKSE